MNRVIRTVLSTVICCLVMILSFSVMLITVSADTDGNFYRTTASANCIYGYSLTDNGVWQTVLPPTCTEKGLKIYTGTQNADVLIEKTQSYPESPHPYADDMNETYGYTVPGAAALRVVFSPSTAFEDGYDNLIIYDKNNNETGVYSGTALAGATVTVPGDTLKMLLKTDGSSTEYGFTVESITPVFAETSHPYNNNADETYSISVEGAHKLVLYFSESTETEENFDIIGIYDNEDNLLGEYSGTQLSGQTVTVFGDSCRITFASDYSNTAYGFRIDNVEAYKTVMQYPEGTEQEIPALGHDITVYSAKEPDCTDSGWYEYEACSRCDYTTYKEIPALGHNEIPHEAKPADCTEDGWLEYVTCSRCSYTTYEAVSAYGHNIINHIPQDATCISVGWEAYETCSRCDYTTYEEIPVDADNHLSTRTVKTTEPTCSAVGYTAGVYCADCEKYVSGHREIGIDTEAHKWDNGIITTVATCKVNGVKTYTCEHNSGHTYTENFGLNMNNHKNVKLKNATEPTCSAVGYTAGVYCADCEKYVSGHREIGIDTEVHKWDNGIITTVATCTVNGVKTYTCEHNSVHTYTENLGLNMNNHKNVKLKDATEPTCSAVGYTAGVYCADCEKYVSGHREIGIDTEAHKWDKGTITTVATCTVNGVKTYICEHNSGHTYTENLGLNMNNHKNVKLKDATEPTCSAVGYTAGVYCADCEKYISGHREIGIDTEAHKWDNGEITTVATCKVRGTKTYRCLNNPDHTYTENLGFNLSNHVNTKDTEAVLPTCSDVGYTAGVYCNDCERYISGHNEIGINADNHKWNQGEITVSASCREAGIRTYTCEYDENHIYTEELGLNKNNHKNISLKEATAPTCSAVGFTAGVYCNDCREYISGHKEIATDTSAHHWDAGKLTIAATCKVSGIKTYTCQHNSAHTYTESLGTDASNHINTSYIAEINATCSSVGYTAGVYCNDCEKYVSGHKEIGMNTDNHKWNSGEITVAASCNVRGKKTYTCENNKEHTYTESLGFDVSNHVNIKASEQTAPTCSSLGYTEGLYCCDCQKYISGHNEIAKDLSAHINTKIVAEIPATSENAGYTSGIYCEDCQRFISGHIEIPKIEADFTDSENAKEAGGYIFVNCSFAAEELLLQAGTGAVITDREGNALSFDNLPGTGMTLTLSNGKQYTVIVSGDVDGDGAVSSSDARLVLRAAVGLEQYKENSNEYLAADVENNSNLSASDARRILRAAVGLEKLYIVKKDLL